MFYMEVLKFLSKSISGDSSFLNIFKGIVKPGFIFIFTAVV